MNRPTHFRKITTILLLVLLLSVPALFADGIASRYPGDKNIASDPAVIFADDFESYTSPSELTNNWDAAYHLPNIRIATELNNVFSGNKSLEFSLPISAIEVSNAAKKIINPTQDTVFIRAYTKFDPGYQVTGSNHNGLRLSAEYPGPGRRPPPDGTGFFLFLLQNNIQGSPRIGESTPGFTALYSYWPRQRSAFGDHWYPDGYVVPFDSGIGEDGEQIGNRGDWLAFPSQYPDFNPMANFLPQRDRWYCYELMVRANTPGQNNGEVKFWIDGTVAGDFPNLNVRSISTLKIDEAVIGLHAQHSERINKKWYDSVVIATQYIGPMVSPTPTPTPTPIPSTPRSIVSDFNGDGSQDFVLQNVQTHQTAIWYLNNNVFIGSAYGPTLPGNWGLRRVSDFNGDSHSDYVLLNTTTDETGIWYLSGPTLIASAFGPSLPSGWELVATADLNGNGHPDYVLYNASTRQTAIWYLNNNIFVGSAFGPTLPAGWTLITQ
jgi:hypothetical protein